MDTKHTPGPWRANAGPSRWNITTLPAPGFARTLNVAAINTDRPEQEANAHLVAAAPDLLQAATQAAQWLDLIEQNCPEMARDFRPLRAAIAKATGEA